MASTEDIAQFDGTGDYVMWKACLRAYALVKRLRNHYLGRCIPVVRGGDNAAADAILLEEYNDKSAQMHGFIVQHTVTGSGPWATCDEYSRSIEAVEDGEGVYRIPELMALLDAAYAGDTSRIQRLRDLRQFFKLCQDGTIEEYCVAFAALVAKLAGLKPPEVFSDLLMAMIFLSGLAPMYSTFVETKLASTDDQSWVELAKDAKDFAAFHGDEAKSCKPNTAAAANDRRGGKATRSEEEIRK
jgi:hypothetical protein